MTSMKTMNRPHRFGWTRAAAVAFAGLVTACSSGPADYVNLEQPVASTAPVTDLRVRTDAQRSALERDLASTGNRQIAAGNAADAGLSSAMALTVIRQQQSEEAKALLLEAGVPPCDPAAVADCAPKP